MAHFVELDENNIILRVIVVDNFILQDESNKENEQNGINFCKSLFGGNWLQTSYNGNFRGRYGGIGYYYNEEENEFYPPPCKNRAEYEQELQRLENLPKPPPISTQE
jgi:hypothetical protein